MGKRDSGLQRLSESRPLLRIRDEGEREQIGWMMKCNGGRDRKKKQEKKMLMIFV